jgi:hypothetical protein
MPSGSPTTFNDVISIAVPQGTNDYFPLCVTLNSQGCFTASGGTDNENVVSISNVQGQIVGTSITKPGEVIGLNWSIPNLGPLQAGNVYQLVVTANVVFAGSTQPTLCSNYKFFIAVDDIYPCPPGHAPTADSMFARVMPRYFRIRLQEGGSGAASPAGSLRLGGLLEPSSVYLAYDSSASTAATPVWRDINLPECMGRWTLRVMQSCCGSTAELVRQPLGPCEVLVPMSFRCPAWSFQGPNAFVLASSARGDTAATPLAVVVEPA